MKAVSLYDTTEESAPKCCKEAGNTYWRLPLKRNLLLLT